MVATSHWLVIDNAHLEEADKDVQGGRGVGNQLAVDVLAASGQDN